MTLMRRAADRRPMQSRDPYRDAMEAWFGGFSDPFESWTGTTWPAMDLRETDDSYIVEVELAGMRPEDAEVMLDGRTLTIRGEFGDDRQEPAQVGNGRTSTTTQQGTMSGSTGTRGGSGTRYLVRERRRGTFVRAVTLPSAVDVDQVSSQFEHGELIVTLPKAQQARARHIEIQGVSRNGGQGSQRQQAGQSSQSGQRKASNASLDAAGHRAGSEAAETQTNGSEDQSSG